jgi:hypothetical protein
MEKQELLFMSSGKDSTRRSLRRKMVLPVTVIRRGGEEKYLAHTLDITEDSARLGGVRIALETGEIIEVHRRGLKAKFQVVWMGAPGTVTSGQAGVRSLEPHKEIWNINLPADEADILPLAGVAARVHTASCPTTKGRWHRRFPCSGVASVRAEGSPYPDHGEVRDIARGGVCIASGCSAPLNTHLHIRINVERITVEFIGVVRNIHPLKGMGIRFEKMSLENRNKIDAILDSLLRNTVEPANHAAKPATISAPQFQPGEHIESAQEWPENFEPASAHLSRP